MATKTCKNKIGTFNDSLAFFLLVTSSHSFSCFSASLQVQQFLLIFKKKKKQKTHQKKRNRKQQTNSAIAAQAFFLLPPTTLFAPVATGLLSYLVPYSTYYPPKNLFTTYLPVTLLSYHFCLNTPFKNFFFTTYLLYTISLIGLFLFVSILSIMYIVEVAIIHTMI